MRRIIRASALAFDDHLESIRLFDTAFELMKNKLWEKAISGFNKVIEINPAATQAFGNMGLCYAHLNENEKAFEAFDKSIALDPQYEPAIINKEILKATLVNGTSFSASQSQMKEIEYMKDYLGKDKLLIQDYLDDTLSKKTHWLRRVIMSFSELLKRKKR